MNYFGLSRKSYILDDTPIKKGGEGAIHSVRSQPDILAKIYLEPDKNPELQEKITLMMQNPPRSTAQGMFAPRTSAT